MMIDRRDVLVTRLQPSAPEPVGVRDRAALPQVVLDRVGVGDPLRLEMREVGRPVADRAGDDHAARTDDLVFAFGPEILAEPVIGRHVSSP
jgi:hypothetical protein